MSEQLTRDQLREGYHFAASKIAASKLRDAGLPDYPADLSILTTEEIRQAQGRARGEANQQQAINWLIESGLAKDWMDALAIVEGRG